MLYSGYIFLCSTMAVNLPCLKGSCPNFLRPTCPYTECWLSFLTGSCPTESTPVSYSSCCSFSLLTRHLLWRYWLISGRVTVTIHPAVDHNINSYLFSFLNCFACVRCSCVYAASAASFAAGYLMSRNSFAGSYLLPFFRIANMTRSILQAITTSDCFFFSGFSGRVV